MTCCVPLGGVLRYWPDGQPDLDAPLAEDSPWVVYDVEGGTPVGPGGAGQYAEKIVGSVVISARMDGNQGATPANPNGGVNGRFAQPDPTQGAAASGGGMPSGARDVNALTVLQNRIGGVSHANMLFSVSVRQPGVTIRVIDVDGPTANNETLRTAGNPFGDDQGFGPYNLGEADQVIPYRQGPFGNQASQIVHTTSGAGGPGYVSPSGAGGEASAYLIYRDHPWGDGTNGAPPISTAFTLSPGQGGRGSQYDFGGQVQQEPAGAPRFARWLCCSSGDRQLVDLADGHTLTPAEAATLERRLTEV